MLFAILLLLLADKPTSLADARAAVEANMKTPAGKAYDQTLGDDFVKNHLDPLRSCKASAGGDLRSFWILLHLNPDGTAKELLLYPETKLGSCARDSLLKGHYPPPPHSDYWGSINMQLSH